MAETDYLALLAKKTAECLHIGYVRETCRDCKGSGRVLDPRFEKLRKRRNDYPKYQGWFEFNGLDYNVVRDLGVMLEIALQVVSCADGLNFELIDGKFKCEVWESYFGHSLAEATDDTFLEAAAHAIYDWVEAQEQEVTK